MLEWVLHKISLLGTWSYLLIFLSALLETAAFLGLLVPGESVVIFSGFLVSQGILELDDCFWVVFAGAVIGDSIGYEIGKRLGKDYFKTHDHLLLVKRKHVEKAEAFFSSHGGKTVFLGRFVGFLRAFAPFLAGMARMPYGRFLIYNVSGGLIWSFAFLYLGYYFGHSWQLVEKWSGKIGLLLFLILVVAGLAFYFIRAVLRRDSRFFIWFEGKWSQILSSSRVQDFIHNHPQLIEFLQNRVKPQYYLGLHFTIGLAISGVFVRIFSEITENILEQSALVRLDHWVLKKTQSLQHPFVTKIMKIATNLGDKWILSVLTIAVIIYFFFKKQGAQAFTTLVAMVGGSLLSQIIKFVIHRQRPETAGQIAAFHGFSFPSGHSMMSAIFYGLLIYFLLHSSKDLLKISISVFLLVLIFLIGLSRIYLEVHYLSDVIAGFAGAAFYLMACLTGLEAYERYKAHQNKGDLNYV